MGRKGKHPQLLGLQARAVTAQKAFRLIVFLRLTEVPKEVNVELCSSLQFSDS